MNTITPRQSLIFCAHYHEGMSFRHIAKVLDLPKSSVYDDYSVVITRLADAFVNSGPDTCTIFIERLFTTWADSEQRQQPRIAALRRDELAQDLDRLMDERAASLEALSECMGANSTLPHTRNKGPAWTHWEIAYLNAKGTTSVPNSAYRADKAGSYSASVSVPCGTNTTTAAIPTSATSSTCGARSTCSDVTSSRAG